MSHVDDGQLNALLDGELSGAEARAVESHVATCADCRRRLEEARAFLHEANTLLDSLSPLAAPAPRPAPASEAKAQEPVRPSRQSVPVRPVGGLADLPGGEAGSVRPPAPPAPKPPLAPPVSAPAAPPRKVVKTAREIAVEIDGRTALTPGISPVFSDELPEAPAAQRARPARRGWDLDKMAWAANIVLALGVGYLANEVRWMHSDRQPTAARVDTVVMRQPAREVARTQSAAPPARSADAVGRREVSGGALSKPPAARHKAAPNITRPSPEADLDARAAQGAGASGLPAAQAPARAQPAAPSLAASARSLRANALDEAAVRPTPGFTRITMEEAVRTLSGSIRQIDGMTPISIEAGGGRLVPGSDASREVVRVNYTDQFGRRFTLDQQLAEPRAGPAFSGIMPGDTLVASAGGGSRVRWLDGKFWLSLSGPVPGNEVRALVGRVR
ncbi:MAG: zf-HC2 domain-containing protein [Gemmatimonadales bacterium]